MEESGSWTLFLMTYVCRWEWCTAELVSRRRRRCTTTRRGGPPSTSFSTSLDSGSGSRDSTSTKQDSATKVSPQANNIVALCLVKKAFRVDINFSGKKDCSFRKRLNRLKPSFYVTVTASVPDPYFFGPPGSESGSVSHKYGSGSFPYLMKVLSGLK